MKIFSLILLSSFLSYADCFQSKDVEVKWVAFKTPSKVGVPGWFKELGLKEKYEGEDVYDLLTGLTFSIDTSSTYTKNTGRDAKIVQYFFGKMSGSKINGSITKASDSEIILNLEMNGKTVEVPLNVKEKKKTIIATGVMDIFDFNMQESLAGINKACEQLHLGKTWNDVDLELKIKYANKCK